MQDQDQDHTTEPANGRRRSRTRRALAGVAVTAAVAAGGLTVAAVNPLGIVGAQEAPSTTSVAPGVGHGGRGALAARGSRVLDESLAALVKDGTLTQAQSDAVRAKVAETGDTLRAEQRTRRQERRQDMEATAAGALGMSATDLRAQLQAGKTLAQVAQAKGVDVQKVTDALVADANTRIDKAVTDGKLDATRAATMKLRTAERIRALVQDGPKRHGTQENPTPVTPN